MPKRLTKNDTELHSLRMWLHEHNGHLGRQSMAAKCLASIARSPTVSSAVKQKCAEADVLLAEIRRELRAARMDHMTWYRGGREKP